METFGNLASSRAPSECKLLKSARLSVPLWSVADLLHSALGEETRIGITGLAAQKWRYLLELSGVLAPQGKGERGGGGQCGITTTKTGPKPRS